MNLIHTSTIAQPSFWQKKGFTISTIGLMTERGILLGELLEVIFCIAFSRNLYVYVCMCVRVYTFLILQVLEKYSTCFAMLDVMAGKRFCLFD